MAGLSFDRGGLACEMEVGLVGEIGLAYVPLVGILDCGFLFGDYHAGLSMDVMDFGGFSYHWGAAGVYLDDQLWCLGMLDQFVGLASDVVVLSASLVIVVWDDG